MHGVVPPGVFLPKLVLVEIRTEADFEQDCNRSSQTDQVLPRDNVVKLASRSVTIDGTKGVTSWSRVRTLEFVVECQFEGIKCRSAVTSDELIVHVD